MFLSDKGIWNSLFARFVALAHSCASTTLLLRHKRFTGAPSALREDPATRRQLRLSVLPQQRTQGITDTLRELCWRVSWANRMNANEPFNPVNSQDDPVAWTTYIVQVGDVQPLPCGRRSARKERSTGRHCHVKAQGSRETGWAS